jgi:hypothetical protein
MEKSMQKCVVLLLWTLVLTPAACKKPASSSSSGAACQTRVGLCAALRSGKSVACAAVALSSCTTTNQVGTCQMMPDDPDGTTLTYYKDFIGDPKVDCLENQKNLKPTYIPANG